MEKSSNRFQMKASIKKFKGKLLNKRAFKRKTQMEAQKAFKSFFKFKFSLKSFQNFPQLSFSHPLKALLR